MNIREEFEDVNLGDARLNSRLCELSELFENRNGESILSTCQDWSVAKSAYRFFSNTRFTEDQIQEPHINSTKERIRLEQGKVLALHDSTELNYTHHKETTGLGYLHAHQKDRRDYNIINAEGIMMHSSLSVTPEGIPLGLLNQKQWCRDIKNFRRIRNAKKNFTRIPIEEKESYKWLECIEKSCQDLDPKNLIHVCDRDADIFELFCHCNTIETNFVVRGVHSRCTSEINVKSYNRINKENSKGYYTLDIPSHRKRVSRRARVLVRFYRVTLLPPKDKSKEYTPVEVTIVSAKEDGRSSTSNEEAINWKLITNLNISSFEEALQVINYYKQRWDIEIYFKTLKTGLGAEKSRLQDVGRIKKFVALSSIIAWKVFWLTKVSRVAPQQKPIIALSHKEIEALVKIEKSKNRKLSDKDTIDKFIIALARVGGYLARKSDPPPGNLVIWRGLNHLHQAMIIME